MNADRPVDLTAVEVRGLLSGERTRLYRPVEWEEGTGEPVNVRMCGLDIVKADAPPGWGYGTVSQRLRCPLGLPETILWVREPHQAWCTSCDKDNYQDDHVCNPHCQQTYVSYQATPREGYRPVPDQARITYLHESSPLYQNRRCLGPWEPASEMPS